jgi:ubiquinone/menaquinone biosynthesis C-methylase UbiE
MENQEKKGFDDRLVNYEYIHGNQNIDFSHLLEALDPVETDVILDGCAGYMDVSKKILSGFGDKKPEIYALDESFLQLSRANDKSLVPEDHLIQGDIAATSFPDNTFDKIVVKMGMHEMPFEKQKIAFQECYRVLKLGGMLIIWDLALPNDETQKLFQDIIREKDRLCGFDALVKNRYFQKYSELVELFDQAGFKNVKKEFPIESHLSMERRLSEFISKDRLDILRSKSVISSDDEDVLYHNAHKRLSALCEYIRSRVPDHMKERIQFRDTGSNIEIVVSKVIMSGKK